MSGDDQAVFEPTTSAADEQRADTESQDEPDPATLAAQVELLREENERLRNEYARARRTTYRRAAIGLLLVGGVGIAGGILFPTSRSVLFVLGAIGIFSAILTYYLTPERFIAASVSEAIYTTLADNQAALIEELGLQEAHIYVPLQETARSRQVAIFVPLHADFELPSPESLLDLFVVTETESERGVAFRPVGETLFREFEAGLTEPLADTPAPLFDQLIDGLTEQFELLDSATIEESPDGETTAGKIAIGITGSAYGEIDRFDHPIKSFLAVGIAIGLQTPVTVESITPTDDRYEYVVTCEWDEHTSAETPGEPTP